MRWIKRGPEPDGVEEYARQFTQGWVDHFRDGQGKRPDNWHWGEYRRLLGSYSNGNCWYCERRCQVELDDGGKAPTVDHFKPLRDFPELAYVWSNWMFSCRRCNGDYKRDSWPPSGYVDPSASEVTVSVQTSTLTTIRRPGRSSPRTRTAIRRCSEESTADN